MSASRDSISYCKSQISEEWNQSGRISELGTLIWDLMFAHLNLT